MRKAAVTAILLVLFALAALATRAQFVGSRVRDDFHDTATILRPPAGAKVAIIVFEDLGCPMCARAHPIELQAAEQFHVPIVRHDFPIASHIWTFNGAVCARYIEDKVNPKLAGEYRTAVFASQSAIASKEDIQQFTIQWLQKHGQQMPFVLDPNGHLAAEVQADFDLGRRLNVTHTPTIVVVTRDNYQMVCGNETLTDPTQLFPILRAAIAQANAAPTPSQPKQPAKQSF
jgi:protein-disulfide isomerase